MANNSGTKMQKIDICAPPKILALKVNFLYVGLEKKNKCLWEITEALCGGWSLTEENFSFNLVNIHDGCKLVWERERGWCLELECNV